MDAHAEHEAGVPVAAPLSPAGTRPSGDLAAGHVPGADGEVLPRSIFSSRRGTSRGSCERSESIWTRTSCPTDSIRFGPVWY